MSLAGAGVYVDKEYKVCCMGEVGVGKTRLVERLTSALAPGVPLSEYIPRVIDCRAVVKYSTRSTTAANLLVNDTIGGFDDYMAARMRPLTLLGSTVLLVMFSVTNRASFEMLPRFLAEAGTFCKGTPIIVVGTKIDARKEPNDESLLPGTVHVTTEEAREEIVKQRDLFYVEVSSEANDNIDELADLIVDAVVSKEERWRSFSPSQTVRTKAPSFISSMKRAFRIGS